MDKTLEDMLGLFILQQVTLQEFKQWHKDQVTQAYNWGINNEHKAYLEDRNK